MNCRKKTIGTILVVLSGASMAWADQASSNPPQRDGSAPLFPNQILLADDQPAAPTGTAAPAPTPAESPTRAPLMSGMDKIGVGQWLDKAGINIYGYGEVGYLYDMTVPHDLTPAKTPPGNAIFFPGDYKNQFMLNQLDLSIERTVDPSKGKFDVGFKVEGIYGRDAFYTHSNGILDSSNKHGGLGGGTDQLDLEQAYVTVAVPVGTGLTIQAGKFVTLMGDEYINPTQNQLYTHSYEFSYGIPFTQTGILASYNFMPNLTTTAGFTRGWNQTLYDNNSAIDFLGQVIYKPNDKLTLTGNLSLGPQATGDNAHWWFVPEVIGSYQVSDNLNVTADLLYGLANALTQWYGVAGYAGYKINSYVTANGRLEFYHDGGGITTGAGTGSDVNYWETTAGVAVTPLPNNQIFSTLTIRPELRIDLANQGVFDGSKFTEVNFAIDAYWKF